MLDFYDGKRHSRCHIAREKKMKKQKELYRAIWSLYVSMILRDVNSRVGQCTDVAYEEGSVFDCIRKAAP